ncbi:MAG: ribulokinase [Chloroflexota bacterium]
MERFALGLDFGTESARAVLVNVESGEVLSSAVHPYGDGVIDQTLPGSDQALPPDWALQNPADWLEVLDVVVPAVLNESGVSGEAVVGVGLDFTACTILPTTSSGAPLCSIPGHRRRPHAWAKLWKHHAAQAQADRVNDLALSRNEAWLARYGGKISSEWLIPKALQILEEAPDLYATSEFIIEGADWLVWQLTGNLARNTCAAGYKANWHKVDGYPSAKFLAAIHPDLVNLYRNKMKGTMVAPGQKVGELIEAWSERLGLKAGTPVAAPIIDAHSAVLGGGVSGVGTMFMIMGTSTCHMLMAEDEISVEGIAGVVEDGIVPGLFGYEAGQAGAGDIFAWYLDHGVPPSYHQEAEAQGLSLHELLTEKASILHPGQSGLLALDWWNGNRSTLVDADLSGLLLGCTLGTRAEDIYRALIEATAFGTRIIIEAFTEQGVPVKNIVTGGSLTKNSMLMQIYADVTGREIAVTGTDQASALGAAMLGAVAARKDGGGHDSLVEATKQMAPPPTRIYRPILDNKEPYNTLYTEYCRLYDYFGRGGNNVMKDLRRLRTARDL